MNSRLPSGETRTTDGFSPPGVGIVATCCAEGTSMTLTFWLNWFVTYAVLPSGEKVTPVGTCPVGVKPSTVRFLVLVMPTPPFWTSVKYARPSSRTAMPKDGGVATSSTNNPIGCVVGSSLGAVVAISAVGGDLSVAHAQKETAPQLRSRPAIVVRCMSASRDLGRGSGELSARPRLTAWAAARPATLIPECVVPLTRFVVLEWRAASKTLRAAATHRVWRANAGRFKMTEVGRLAVERRRSESNRRIEVLQTSALPLGYGAG